MDLLEGSAEDLYEHAPCGYLSTFPDGTIAKVNETFLGWTGYRREDLIGKRFQDLLTAGGKIYHETHYAPLLRMQDAVREIAFDVVRADSSRLPALVNSDLKRDAAGEPALIRTTVFDATDRKEYERELRRARDRERAARERTERLARITHVLAGAVDAREVAAAIVGELAESVAADACVFALAGERLEVAAALGEPGAWESAASAALRSGEPRFGDGLAVIPLVVDGRSIGVLWLGFAETRGFSESDRAFLVAAAGQAAQALERVRLHERTVQSARRWAFLAETISALDELHGTERRAQRLADLVVARVADAATVELVVDGERTIVAAAGADAHDPRLDDAVAEAIATREPRLVRGAGAALPLRARGRVVGALALSAHEPFGSEDMAFLSSLADRAALALENERLYEEQRTVAQTLQHSLLAGEPPRDPRFRVATKYRPAFETLDVGGDWYDTFAVGDGTVGIVVGDVVGRGLEAATAMGQLRSAVRALAGAQLGPARLIEHLDVFVDSVESARWATLAYAEIELASGRARFACAGHPPPLLAQPGEPPRLLWDGRSTPLGTHGRRAERDEAAVELQPGARLLLYTDGLFERRTRPLDEGLDRLVEEFGLRRDAPLPALIDELAEAMLVDEQGQDDVCLLCLSFGVAQERPAVAATGSAGAT